MIEGWKLIHEALHSGIPLLEIYVTPEALQEPANASLIDRSVCPVFALSRGLMEKVSTLESPPGVLAIGQSMSEPADPSPDRLGVLLLSIRDPGNFGTIVRSAEATGCDRVAYTFDCVDPHQTKVVRASMGSVFRVPLVEVSDINTTIETLIRRGISLYALSTGNAPSLFDVAPRVPSMVLVGSEAQGLPSNLSPDVSMLSIPMAGRVESLNAAMAAVVALYHFSRCLPRENINRRGR